MTTPVSYTGHPDFIPVNSVPIPVLSAQLGPFAAGTTSSAETVNATSGGAYLLAITPTVSTDVVIADVTVQHYDFKGNLVYTDFFGAAFAGSGINAGLFTSGPTLLRGNIYGPVLKMTVQTASQTWVNTVLGGTFFTVTGCSINMYIIPGSLGDPDPKMSNGSAEQNGVVGTSPGTLLQVLNNVSIPVSTSEGPFILTPYSGPAQLNYRQNGLSTTPSNFRLTLAGYSVANGTGSIFVIPFDSGANLTDFSYSLNIPCCMMILNVVNEDAAQTTIAYVSIIGVRTA